LQPGNTRYGNKTHLLGIGDHRRHDYRDTGISLSLSAVVIICSLGVVLLVAGLIGIIAFASAKRRRRHSDREVTGSKGRPANMSWPRRQNSAFHSQVYYNYGFMHHRTEIMNDLNSVVFNSQRLCITVTYLLSASLTLVKEALIEIGCVVTSLVVGCHARALWPNGAS